MKQTKRGTNTHTNEPHLDLESSPARIAKRRAAVGESPGLGGVFHHICITPLAALVDTWRQEPSRLSAFCPAVHMAGLAVLLLLLLLLFS